MGLEPSRGRHLPFEVLQGDGVPQQVQELLESWALLIVPKQLLLQRLEDKQARAGVRKRLLGAKGRNVVVQLLVPFSLSPRPPPPSPSSGSVLAWRKDWGSLPGLDVGGWLMRTFSSNTSCWSVQKAKLQSPGWWGSVNGASSHTPTHKAEAKSS